MVQAPIEIHSNDYDMYYEVGIGSKWFMTGACTNCSGTGKTGMKQLENLFEFLSVIYHVPISRTTVSFKKANKVHFNLGSMLNAIQDERRSNWFKDRHEEEQFTEFKIGDRVKLTDEALTYVASEWGSRFSIDPRLVIFEIFSIKNLPPNCSCGLGDDPAIPLDIHICNGPAKCNLVRRNEAIHTQILRLAFNGTQLPDQCGDMSGYYLTHA